MQQVNNIAIATKPNGYRTNRFRNQFSKVRSFCLLLPQRSREPSLSCPGQSHPLSPFLIHTFSMKLSPSPKAFLSPPQWFPQLLSPSPCPSVPPAFSVTPSTVSFTFSWVPLLPHLPVSEFHRPSPWLTVTCRIFHLLHAFLTLLLNGVQELCSLLFDMIGDLTKGFRSLPACNFVLSAPFPEMAAD